MNNIVNEVVKRWCHYFIDGDKKRISELFIADAVGAAVVNSIAIDTSQYIIEHRVDKWYKHLDNKIDIYFKIIIKMELQGIQCTCDVVSYHMTTYLIDSTLKILKVDEIDCYPWELHKLNCIQINSGSLYFFGKINCPLDTLEDICNEVLAQMKSSYGEEILNNIGIIVFDTSSALEDFLEEILQEGCSLGGKAKLNHIFISETNNITRMKQVLRHELTHLVLYRKVKSMDNKDISINPILSESISHLAENNFDNKEYTSVFKRYLENKFYKVIILEDLYVKSMEESQHKIYIGLALLAYIGEVYGKNYILEFIIEASSLRSIENAIKTVFNISVNDFESSWNQYIKQIKEIK